MPTGSPEGDGHTPLLDAVIKIGGVSQSLKMLLDSGADTTCLPIEIVSKMLGKPFEEIGDQDIEVRGIGNVPWPGRVTDGEIIYQGRSVTTRIIVCEIMRPVLGRDFFKAFNVRFYWERTPPQFFIDPLPVKVAGRGFQPVNPTIRPRKKR